VANHWVGFRLEGRRSNRDGVGARITIRTGYNGQIRVVRSGSSYCSHSDTRPLFGLGRSHTVDSVRIEWPSGGVQEIRDLPTDRYYLVKEGVSFVPDPRGKPCATSLRPIWRSKQGS
jgi:hypothetical protein